MKVAHILPQAHLNTQKDNDYHMVLPSWCHEPRYVQWFQNAKGYKILDNGAAENDEQDWDRLFRLADEIGVNEIVIPDVMGDTDASIGKAAVFLEEAKKRGLSGKYKFGAVVHGSTMEEVVMCYTAYAINKFKASIDLIYLPRIIANNVHHDIRINLLKAIDSGTIDAFFPEIHCLGASLNLKEVMHLKTTSCRGIDTSAVGTSTYRDIDIRKDATYRSRSEDYFEATLNTYLLDENLEFYNKLAS